ncbi:trypsin-like peptidase domain-containing protein [Streptomyces griseosporeus]|uniref:trypsin-like peptidase domain-containing protein n=1 Tax=Streptomyces griseosporeus TaxID=1910 RepID=UPI0036F8D296
MAGRGPRDAGHTVDGTRLPDTLLVHLTDLAGRPRGVGFLADHLGTLVTGHEAVDGLPRLVLRTADGRDSVVTADAVTPLPHRGLALVRTEGLGLEPLPVTVRDRVDAGTYVRVPAGCWREARVLGTTGATYTATDRCHRLDDALELAIGTAGRDALRLGGGAAGGPVLDAATGAVVGVVGTALTAGHAAAGFAVPLRPAADGPLAELLARNAATVPAYGADLNLAGILELTATSVGQDGPLAGGGTDVEPVERDAIAREFAAFADGDAAVLALVGAPGSGRTTELAALAARRGRDPHPAPTLWLRGADLHEDDTGIADAARRALTRAARIVAASRGTDVAWPSGPAEPHPHAAGSRPAAPCNPPASGPEHRQTADTGAPDAPGAPGVPEAPDGFDPGRPARLARAAGRPLLLLLDGPEEMPPVLAHRLGEWTAGTAQWLRETGARLVVACRDEYWEGAGARFPRELLHAGRDSECDDTLPPRVRLSDLGEEEARRARQRYRIPEGALAAPDARHPLALRLFAEVRAALPEAPQVRVDRHDVFAAHLDLMCLRIAVRLAAGNGLRGTAVRRLAAKVAGQVHEAARRSLGPGQGELDREAFEAVFPWGPAPDRLGGGTGWASAVLTEGLLVPAGGGYRFAHEELADWLQGMHLDLDEALRALVHRGPHEAHPLPVPHHRIGPVVQALLLLARQHGTRRLTLRLDELAEALDADPDSWWAARLLTEVLSRVPDATPYLGVLRDLADRIADRRLPPGRFGPAFWTGLRLRDADRLDLLRRLVLADTAPQDGGAPRYLDGAARLLATDPAAVQPYLLAWFDDERPLPATPHATVATAAQALLHTHRHRALDDLIELLVDRAHPRAGELLAVLAEDEPSALCRAVDRWARDERPGRRAAAVTYGLRAAPHVRTEADRELLRYAALALLARPADAAPHGGALALLVRDPATRARHLPQALRRFAAGDPELPPNALLTALTTHPDAVLDAFRTRLAGPAAGAALRALAEVTEPGPARRIAELVREAAALRPDMAEDVAAYVDTRLDRDPRARTDLLPLVTGLLDGGPERVRAALAAVLAVPGTPASRPLRRELREILLAHERDPGVLAALLHAAVYRGDGDELRGLLHRTGLLLVRTPEGAARLDHGLVDLARHVPGFAARLAGWLAEAPADWAALVGPSARRTIENLAGVRVPA